MKMSKTSTKSFWTSSYKKNWNQSNLGTLINKPSSGVADALALKTRALQLLSIDMSSTGVLKPPSNIGSRLRAKTRGPTYRGTTLY